VVGGRFANSAGVSAGSADEIHRQPQLDVADAGSARFGRFTIQGAGEIAARIRQDYGCVRKPVEQSIGVSDRDGRGVDFRPPRCPRGGKGRSRTAPVERPYASPMKVTPIGLAA
jgi:hypothetical protein